MYRDKKEERGLTKCCKQKQEGALWGLFLCVQSVSTGCAAPFVRCFQTQNPGNPLEFEMDMRHTVQQLNKVRELCSRSPVILALCV